MATAYKSVQSQRDFGMSESDDAELSDGSSTTIQADPQPLPKRDRKVSGAGMRSRVLMLTTRGISHRHRHLLNDLHLLLPHAKKDSKLDSKASKSYNSALNALADLHACNYIFLLEARKQGQDLYLWLAKAPNGPTIKFSVSNVHTMGELDFGGNCLKGARGVVVFDKSFEDGFEHGAEYKSVARELLAGIFCVPKRGVRGMKPFIDHVIGVFGVDGKIWIRVYEIREAEKGSGEAGRGMEVSLVEIGPRFVLTPIVVLEASFSGPVLFENKQYVSANQVRSEARLRRVGKYTRRRGEAEDRIVKMGSLGLVNGSERKQDDLDDTSLFT